MSSHGRRRFNGLDLVLLIIFDFALVVDHIWASDETCGEINGQSLCYFKAWDFGVDWDAAWQLCNSRNATLPVIRNGDEQDIFAKYLNVHMSGSVVWTSGRNYTYDNWTWVDGQQYSGRGRIYRLSGPQRYQPVLEFGFFEYDANPRTLLHYICQYSGDACNYFNDTLNVTNGCIILSDDRRSWYDARNQCLITGGDLAVLDEADLRYQRFHFQYKSRRHYEQWIGLRKTSWRWNFNKNASEDDEIKYTNWSKDWNPIIGDCISIDALNGTWRTTECSDKLKVVCQTGLHLDSVERESQSVSYSTFIAVVIFGICIIVILIIVITFIVRKYIYRTAQEASSSETTANRSYQDLEMTRRQANPNAIYTELQPQLVYEEVGQRRK